MMSAIHLLRQRFKVWQLAMLSHVGFSSSQQSFIQKQRDHLARPQMDFYVLFARGCDQILRPVVIFHAVDVVDGNVSAQSDASSCFVHMAVFKDVPVPARTWFIRLVDTHVAVWVAIRAAFPAQMFCASFRQQGSYTVSRHCRASSAP